MKESALVVRGEGDFEQESSLLIENSLRSPRKHHTLPSVHKTKSCVTGSGMQRSGKQGPSQAEGVRTKLS